MCKNSIADSDNKSDKNDAKKLSGVLQNLEKVKLTPEMVKDLVEQEFIYSMLIEKGKISMIFADAGVSKTLIATGFAIGLSAWELEVLHSNKGAPVGKPWCDSR